MCECEDVISFVSGRRAVNITIFYFSRLRLRGVTVLWSGARDRRKVNKVDRETGGKSRPVTVNAVLCVTTP
jgi:hypothetical protein